MITFTDRAAAKVRELLADRPDGGAGLGLRVSVRPGGCAGYEYALAFDRGAGADDRVFAAEGFDVFVDPQSARLLSGVRIDYVEGLRGAGFTFDNPNARAACGCGNSFSAADAGDAAEPDPALGARVAGVLEALRPFLRADGGDVELVDVRGATARVRLAGACAGCSGAVETLKRFVERRVREAVPEISRVIAV